MMKFSLIILMATILPFTLFSSLSLLLILLTLMAFYVSHFQENFICFQSFMWDTLSFTLISLSVLITILMLLASLSSINIMKFKHSFSMVSLSLLFILTITFSVTNLILFYILFEASLIPIFTMILGWGSQPERLQAGMYMLIYTVLSSLPLLISLLLWSSTSNSTSLLLLSLTMNSKMLSNFLAYTLILAFSVKLPLYLLHLWLPKAHVEASVAGSMILAAILLKLGGYGVLRISSKSHMIFNSINSMMLTWSLTGGVIIAMVCLFQSDIKFLIALSSVAHMSLVMASALTFSNWGINSALIIMIGHGFCSSGLFCAANMLYERSNSRSLFLLKGFQTIIPAFSILWFMLCTSNMSAPPSLNLLGEMMGISSVFMWSSTLMFMLFMLVFLSAAYSLYLYSQTQHGKLSLSLKPLQPVSLREWLLLLTHWAPLNLFFLAPWMMQIYI